MLQRKVRRQGGRRRTKRGGESPPCRGKREAPRHGKNGWRKRIWMEQRDMNLIIYLLQLIPRKRVPQGIIVAYVGKWHPIHVPDVAPDFAAFAVLQYMVKPDA